MNRLQISIRQINIIQFMQRRDQREAKANSYDVPSPRLHSDSVSLHQSKLNHIQNEAEEYAQQLKIKNQYYKTLNQIRLEAEKKILEVEKKRLEAQKKYQNLVIDFAFRTKNIEALKRLFMRKIIGINAQNQGQQEQQSAKIKVGRKKPIRRNPEQKLRTIEMFKKKLKISQIAKRQKVCQTTIKNEKREWKKTLRSINYQLKGVEYFSNKIIVDFKISDFPATLLQKFILKRNTCNYMIKVQSIEGGEHVQQIQIFYVLRQGQVGHNFQIQLELIKNTIQTIKLNIRINQILINKYFVQFDERKVQQTFDITIKPELLIMSAI